MTDDENNTPHKSALRAVSGMPYTVIHELRMIAQAQGVYTDIIIPRHVRAICGAAADMLEQSCPRH